MHFLYRGYTNEQIKKPTILEHGTLFVPQSDVSNIIKECSMVYVH
jgi:hypothetical protein